MEAATAVKLYTNEGKSLADKVNEYIRDHNLSISAMAAKINYSRPTVSRYLSGKYDSDATELESKLTAFLAEETGSSEAGLTAVQEAPQRLMVVDKLIAEKLHRCLAQLSKEEQALIFALYFQGKSQSELERETGIKQQTISYRERQIRLKLKKMIEK